MPTETSSQKMDFVEANGKRFQYSNFAKQNILKIEIDGRFLKAEDGKKCDSLFEGTEIDVSKPFYAALAISRVRQMREESRTQEQSESPAILPEVVRVDRKDFMELARLYQRPTDCAQCFSAFNPRVLFGRVNCSR